MPININNSKKDSNKIVSICKSESLINIITNQNRKSTINSQSIEEGESNSLKLNLIENEELTSLIPLIINKIELPFMIYV